MSGQVEIFSFSGKSGTPKVTLIDLSCFFIAYLRCTRFSLKGSTKFVRFLTCRCITEILCLSVILCSKLLASLKDKMSHVMRL